MKVRHFLQVSSLIIGKHRHRSGATRTSQQCGIRVNRSIKPPNAQKVADAINTYADAAESLATTIQRLRPQLEKLPADEPAACQAANRRLEAFQPEINAVIEKLDYKRRRYSADRGVINAWRRVIKITKE